MSGENENPERKKLRQLAEEIVKTEEPSNFTISEAKDLIHELQVAYTEVEMQCEELKQTRNSLEELNARYKTLFYSAPVGFLVLDQNKKIMEINSAGVSFIGNERNNVLGRDFSGYLSGASLRAFRDLIGRISENSPRQQREILLHNRGSGAELWVNLHICVLEERENFPLTYLAAITDLSKQKEAESILQRDKEVLEELVEERSEQLIQVRKEGMRRKRLQELGRLSATVAHELRRPLASMQLSLYNIRKKNKNKALEKQLSNCEEKIFEGEQIINNLLKSSSLNEPDFQEVDLFRLITDCIGELRGFFKKDNLRLHQDLTAIQKTDLEADPVQMKEVIFNVLQNAYEAAPEKNGRIWVQGIISDGSIGFTVTDNDNGIPEDELDKIAEPFYTTKHLGIGLGLTVAREIITMHEGELKIESTKGVGTTVTVTFPRDSKKGGKNAAQS